MHLRGKVHLVTIDQRGVDLTSTLAGPDGKTIFELHLIGKGSRESLVLITDQTGRKRLLHIWSRYSRLNSSNWNSKAAPANPIQKPSSQLHGVPPSGGTF